jgi:beta-lactamase regulating signal transducer with metallopeptidase domain
MIQALGWTLLHSVWQISLLALVFLLVIRCSESHQPRLRYGLGVLFMSLSLLFSTITFASYFSAGDSQFRDTYSLATAHEAELAFRVKPSPTAPDATLGLQDLLQQWINRHMHWITGAWMLGAFCFALRFFGSLWYLQRLRKEGCELLPMRWQQKGNEILELLEISRPVCLLSSTRVQMPLMLGYFKPLVLIPASMLSQFPPEQIEAILAHEIAHIYRRDYLVNLLQSWLEIIFFFHPALWWMSTVVRDEREKCCDDLAVRISGDSLVYAKALASVEGMRQPFPLVMSLGAGRRGLLQRIERLLQPRQEAGIDLARLISAGMAIILLTLLISAQHGVKLQKIKYRAEMSSIFPGKMLRYDQFQDAAFASETIPDSLPDSSPRAVLITDMDSLILIESDNKNIDSLYKELDLADLNSMDKLLKQADSLQQSIMRFSMSSDPSDARVQVLMDSSGHSFSIGTPGNLNFNKLQFTVDSITAQPDTLDWQSMMDIRKVQHALRDSSIRKMIKEQERRMLIVEQRFLREEQEFAREMQQLEREIQQMAREQEPSFKIDRLEKRLIADGLIEQGKQYDFEIDDRRMKVNRRKVDETTYRDYRAFFEENAIITFEEGNKVAISKIAK